MNFIELANVLKAGRVPYEKWLRCPTSRLEDLHREVALGECQLLMEEGGNLVRKILVSAGRVGYLHLNTVLMLQEGQVTGKGTQRQRKDDRFTFRVNRRHKESAEDALNRGLEAELGISPKNVRIEISRPIQDRYISELYSGLDTKLDYSVFLVWFNKDNYAPGGYNKTSAHNKVSFIWRPCNSLELIGS